MYKLFGREPAIYLTMISAVVMAVGLFVFPLSVNQQGMLNAASVAVFGVIGAFILKDGLSSALLGFVQAILALVISFGAQLSVDKQTGIMVLASALVAMFVRTQATAPVPPTEAPVKI